MSNESKATYDVMPTTTGEHIHGFDYGLTACLCGKRLSTYVIQLQMQHADLIAALKSVVYDIDNSDGLHSVDARTEDKVKAALAKAGAK